MAQLEPELDPAMEGLHQASEKAERYFGRHVAQLASSEAVRSAVQTASAVVREEGLPHRSSNAATAAVAEAAGLGAMTRECQGEPQLSREDIQRIKDFFEWLFNGIWRRE